MPRKTRARDGRRPPRARASMRPRPDAAENAAHSARTVPGNARFNEAAARCRGKRSPRRATTCRRFGFNEAAARCRGKREKATKEAAEAEKLQ